VAGSAARCHSTQDKELTSSPNTGSLHGNGHSTFQGSDTVRTWVALVSKATVSGFYSRDGYLLSLRVTLKYCLQEQSRRSVKLTTQLILCHDYECIGFSSIT
jgi:hypothetical protein